MDRVNEFVEAVTRRLRADRELHMDVAHEVRAHLEDAAAEARAQGGSEEETLEAAMKAFGDPDEVAEQLYEANRRRMRVHALAKWANRLVLVPAALAVALLLCSFTVRTGKAVLGNATKQDLWEIVGLDELLESPPPARAGLSEDETFKCRHLTEELTDAEQLIARFPDDPVLYAHYVRLLSEGFDRADPAYEHQRPASDEEFQGWLAVLDRGEQVEPDNAFYDYMKATLMMMRSSRIEVDAGLPFEYPSADAEDGVARRQGARVVILDRAMFERAMGQVYEGMAKAHFTSHAADVVHLREALWRPPRTLDEWLAHTARHGAVLMPHLSQLRGLFLRLPARALALAETGDAEGAARLAERMARPAVQMGGDAGSVIELLVAQYGFSETAGLAPEILKLVGRPAEAAEARRAFETTLVGYNRLRQEAKDRAQDYEKRQRIEGSVTGAMLRSHLATSAWWEMDARLRGAEHVVLERLALGVAMMGAVALVSLMVLASAWSGWRRAGAGDGPKLFFIGWRRMAGVLLVGLAVPLALYWAFTRLLPLGGLELGVSHVFRRRMAEIGVLYVAAVLVTASATYEAVRRRCLEAGMDVGAPGRLNPLRNVRSTLLAAALSVGLGIAAMAPTLWWLGDDAQAAAFTAGTVTAVAVFPLVFVLWQLRHLGFERQPRRRRIVSLPTAAAVLVGLPIVALAALRLTFLGWREPLGTATLIVGGAVILPLVYVAARGIQPGPSERRLRHFRRTARRSMVPVLAVALLVLGVLSHAYLSAAEAHHLAPLAQPELQWWHTNMASLEEYRGELAELSRQWLAEHVGTSLEPLDAPASP